MKLFRTTLAVAAIVPVLVASRVEAATQAWVVSYNYKKLNNTTLVSAAVTQDAGDQTYAIQERPNNVKVTAPLTNTGGNTREFFWPASGPDVTDSESCAVWSKQYAAPGVTTDSITQQGAALRIVQTPTSTRGITVTKNIFFGATWFFNVHVWDSASNEPFTQLAGFDMSEVMGKMWWDEQGSLQSNLKPLPWHLCARTVGNTLKFKVWPDDVTPQPSWNDSRYVREVQIPAAWDVPGKAGWYIGHLNPGHSAEFQGLQTQYR
ncbi:MAG TPA: hypothetical protein VK674_06710 [Candidatus Limnocylindria bacterium]|nr:hypothetical protein [Candidatus Limnocylindria bacterium]